MHVEYTTISNECQLLVTTPMKIAMRGYEWKNNKDIGDTQFILPLKQFEKREKKCSGQPVDIARK